MLAILIQLLMASAVADDRAGTALLRSRQDPDSPERRALSFLMAEVPRWQQENHCYSCHNNGDAARALYTARHLGYPVPDRVLQDTTTWLRSPRRWKDNGGDQRFSDQQLADLQFAFALHTAIETENLSKTSGLAARSEAASLVLSHQTPAGSWKIDSSNATGSPTTYGEVLATAAAFRVLGAIATEDARAATARAAKWLAAQRPVRVNDAAGALLAVDPQAEGPMGELREHCLQVIRRGEAETGGWGPYVIAPPENFDTALVLLALAGLERGTKLQPMLVRGRRFLIQRQLEDGSWIETTRPANAVSYAQRLSTSGWATLALLRTVGIDDNGREETRK